MNRDRRAERDYPGPSGRHRRSAAATAPSYDFPYSRPDGEAPRSRGTRPGQTARRRRSPANRRFAVLMVGLLLWAGLGYATGLVRIVALRGDIAKVQGELATVRKHNQELEKTVAEMQTPEYIERAARDQLGLTRPDEVRFVVGKRVDQTNPDHRDVAKRAINPKWEYHD